MDIHIDENELRLLTFLHENRKGYGPTLPFYVYPQLLEAAGLSEPDFSLAISYLVEHCLAGMNAESLIDENGSPDARLNDIWITGLGEDYMRALENQPGIGRKITVAVLKEAKGLIMGTASAALGDFVKRFIAPQA
jgi:hypothetical protein